MCTSQVILTVRTEIRIISDAVYVSYFESSYVAYNYNCYWSYMIVFLFAENPSGLVKFRSVLNVNIFFLENTYY